MKNSNLTRNLIIGVVLLFVIGISVFMIFSTKENRDVVTISKPVVKKEQDKVTNKSIDKNPIEKTNSSNETNKTEKSEKVDYDNEFYNCEKRVKIPGGRDICAEGENQLVYGIEINPSGDTQRERKEALKEIAYDVLEKMGPEKGTSAFFIDPFLGKNICKTTILGHIDRANHQGDPVNVLFCNDLGEYTVLLELKSGGMDDSGNEYLAVYGMLPLAGAFFADEPDFSDVEGQSLEELKKESNAYMKERFLQNTIPSVSYEEALSKLKKKFSNVTLDSTEENFVCYLREGCGTSAGYRFPVTKSDGTKEILYVDGFLDEIVTQDWVNAYIEEVKKDDARIERERHLLK